MKAIPKPIARRVIYWNLVAAVTLVSLALSLLVRRHHPYDGLVVAACRRYRMHPALISAVIWKESRFNAVARGAADEIGLMQVTPGAGADWASAAGVTDFSAQQLWDPQTNVLAGTWYLARAADHWEQAGCPDPLPYALAEYNAGRVNVQRWTGNTTDDPEAFLSAISFPSTRDYVRDVLKRYRGGGH